jgi:lysozyme
MEKVIKISLLSFFIFFLVNVPLSDGTESITFMYDYESNHTTRSLIEEFEGLRLVAYRCPAGVATIGIGSTYYENGKKVKIGDKISLRRANQLYNFNIIQVERQLENLVKVNLTENQESALTSFLYNVGYGNFKRSRLLEMINHNPNNPRIQQEFLKWTTSKGVPLKGLKKRRIEELKLYFTKN